MSQLCLGTVQFGMKYGINNQIGRQPTWDESFEMLDYALAHGIKVIDTASAYGEAEPILGEYFRGYRSEKNIKVISKLRPNVIENGERDISGTIHREIETTLNRLGLLKLDGYLLHTPEYIYNPYILEGLQQLKEQNYVKNIGVSIYDLREGDAAIETGIVDYIQLPYSILDQRGIQDGFIHEAKKAGITIFARSAFLQGLFMMSEEEIPEHLLQVVPHLQRMNQILREYDVDKISAILNFVDSEQDIDYLVFGVEKKEQLIEDISKFGSSVPQECINKLKEQAHNIEKSIIFPSLWSNGRKAT